jgi:hypothetical protein
MNLLKNSKFIVFHRGTTAAAATDIDSTVLADMQGYEGILIWSGVEETTAGGTTGTFQMVPRHSAVNSSTTGITDLGSTAYAATTALTTNHWGHVVAVDVYRPTQRYVGVTVNKTGANTVDNGPIMGLLYSNHKGPVTQSTAYVIQSKQLISPTT